MRERIFTVELEEESTKHEYFQEFLKIFKIVDRRKGTCKKISFNMCFGFHLKNKYQSSVLYYRYNDHAKRNNKNLNRKKIDA